MAPKGNGGDHPLPTHTHFGCQIPSLPSWGGGEGRGREWGTDAVILGAWGVPSSATRTLLWAEPTWKGHNMEKSNSSSSCSLWEVETPKPDSPSTMFYPSPSLGHCKGPSSDLLPKCHQTHCHLLVPHSPNTRCLHFMPCSHVRTSWGGGCVGMRVPKCSCDAGDAHVGSWRGAEQPLPAPSL